MASDKEMGDFLAGVETRAFKTAQYAVRDADAALDIVQEAMVKLAERYGDRPAGELPLLFQRILQTTTLDHFRRQKVRDSRFASLASLGLPDDVDPLETLTSNAVAPLSMATRPADDTLGRTQTLTLIDAEIDRLPARQREAFLLRYWEDMDVAQTAALMGCSEGSVKTHCSRAVRTLAAALQAKGITL
ncbi:RNA polymerase sigma factor [Chitinasiproducens palmae]|uniref:RNA polymerase, sigma-24 subunit, RpoE n=1 Tax=Chitinasiproducens palmae TaxID=1770053 RepID=A0A1H2PTI2_9BURK|nr:RNA polymerase sigma factor [Chitinasiproducens palmae]SDV50029.1 RNA polymerase, sigma-24 subunit, RpoE [Chitinasiproducens palmae]